MHIHGVDFTSAPSSKKPIVIASAFDSTAIATEVTYLSSLNEFESWLNTAKGVIGIDSPFGYPTELCQALFPEMTWVELAKELGKIKPEQSLRILEERVATFRDARPLGSKEPKRSTDRHSNAFSAMKFGRPPVGRMAARLLPILERSSHSILPVRTTDSSTVVVEVFPGKLVRDAIGRQSYKGDKGTHDMRARIIEILNIQAEAEVISKAIQDKEGDVLDSLVALKQIQSWIANGRQMPTVNEATLEGWII